MSRGRGSAAAMPPRFVATLPPAPGGAPGAQVDPTGYWEGEIQVSRGAPGRSESSPDGTNTPQGPESGDRFRPHRPVFRLPGGPSQGLRPLKLPLVRVTFGE